MDQVADSFEKICYRVNGTVLERSQQDGSASCGTNGWQVLANDVLEFNLELLNSIRGAISDGNAVGAGLECWPPPIPAMPTPGPNAACYVRIRLRARETIRQQVVDKRLSGEVAIRN